MTEREQRIIIGSTNIKAGAHASAFLCLSCRTVGNQLGGLADFWKGVLRTQSRVDGLSVNCMSVWSWRCLGDGRGGFFSVL